MNGKINFNPSTKYHLLVGLFAGVWITLFLVFVGPFDTADLSLRWRAQVMFGYGLIFFVCYIAVIPIQNRMYHRTGSWGLWQEITVFVIVFSLSLLGCFLYYRSDIIRGDYSFYAFLLQIYFPTLLIFTPLLVIARWFVNRLGPAARPTTQKPDAEEIDMAAWKPKIQKLLDDEVYLKNDLTLKEMAHLLDTNSSILSKVINRGYGLNFNDFVNQYRIEAVLAAFRQGQHKTRTLPGIAHNCGFNSKATFNRAFKKHFQISPSDYIRQMDEGGAA